MRTVDLETEYITENGIEYKVCTNSAGNRYWYLNGVLHRELGPAVEIADRNFRAWCRYGKYHRGDGPACIWADGTKLWYWNGTQLSYEVEEQGIDQLSPEEIKFWLPIIASNQS